MLRIIEHGYKVKMIQTKKEAKSVDTIDDLKQVERLMKDDILIKKYHN